MSPVVHATQTQLQVAMRLASALARFLVQMHADGRSPHTVAQYARHLSEFGEWAQGRGLGDVRDVEPEDVAEYLGSPVATRRSDGRRRDPVTVNSRRTSLRMFFAYLESIDAVERSPARVLRMARTRAPEPRAMPATDVERLLGALRASPGKAAQRDHALVAFMLATGARLSSALRLRVRDLDLDLDAGVATLRDVKGGGAQRVFLREDVVGLLRELVGDCDDGPVFEARDGGPVSSRHLQRRFEEWLERAGIRGRYSPHSLRHTFAMGLYQRTGDVLVVQAALGHRAVTSTLVYARASAERVRAAVVG